MNTRYNQCAWEAATRHRNKYEHLCLSRQMKEWIRFTQIDARRKHTCVYYLSSNHCVSQPVLLYCVHNLSQLTDLSFISSCHFELLFCLCAVVRSSLRVLLSRVWSEKTTTIIMVVYNIIGPWQPLTIVCVSDLSFPYTTFTHVLWFVSAYTTQKSPRCPEVFFSVMSLFELQQKTLWCKQCQSAVTHCSWAWE